jgi:phytoene synthase
VADLVRQSAVRHGLPRGLLIGYIDAQGSQLYDSPLPEEAALRAHLARTEGALFELGLRILGRRDELAPRIAGAAGRAYGLVRILTELPALWSQGRTLIPASVLEAEGIALGDTPAEEAEVRLSPILKGFAAEARHALTETRQLSGELTRAERVAILPVALVEPYLRVLEKAGRNPIRDLAELAPLERIWPLFRSYWSGRL